MDDLRVVHGCGDVRGWEHPYAVVRQVRHGKRSLHVDGLGEFEGGPCRGLDLGEEIILYGDKRVVCCRWQMTF